MIIKILIEKLFQNDWDLSLILFYTDFLQYLIKNDAKLKAINIKNGWLELDSINDYKIYHTLMESGNLPKFFRI